MNACCVFICILRKCQILEIGTIKKVEAISLALTSYSFQIINVTENTSSAQNVSDLEVELKVGPLKVHICGVEVSQMSVLMTQMSSQFHF